METTTPAPTFSPPVETPVEKLIRETLEAEVAKATGTANKYFSGQIHALNYSGIAETITAALTEAGHICAHVKFTQYGQCAACGRDMIPDLLAMPNLTEIDHAVISNMANAEPEPRPLTRQIGRVAFRRVKTLEIRRRALNGLMSRSGAPSNFDRAEYAALSFAIDNIHATYGEEPHDKS